MTDLEAIRARCARWRELGETWGEGIGRTIIFEDVPALIAEVECRRQDDKVADEHIARLHEAGAVLLRAIYESGIAYQDPKVEAALAFFAGEIGQEHV